VTTRLLPVLLGAALLAAPAASPAADENEAAERYSVKVSLSREDPDVRTMKSDADVIDFYVFVDGAPTRGAEFGIEIEGGSLVAYVIDTEKTWVALPIENPYPGTIAQAKAGPDCFEPPVYFGRLMVTPDSPGGTVELRVIPSVRAAQTAVIHCDQSGSYAVQAYHAAVNGTPRKSERLESVKQEPTGEPHDHGHGSE
jgi:hypothetical protein